MTENYRKRPQGFYHLPRLFNGRTATAFMDILRRCEKPGGYSPQTVWFKYGEYNSGCFWQQHTFYRLHAAGLAYRDRSGPRGGRRWKPTEFGQLLLDIIRIHGSSGYVSSFELLGFIPGKQGIWFIPEKYRAERDTTYALK